MRNILTIFIFSIFVFGCNTDGSLFSSISLISPLNETIDYCDIDFKWKGKNIDSAFVLEIATDNGFETVIYTDIVTENSHLINGNLEPNQQYFWRVMADGESEIGSFTTIKENKLSDFEGIFPVNAEHWFPAEPLTTWSDTLQIVFNNGIPQLVTLDGNIIVAPEIFIGQEDCNKLVFRKIPNPIDPTIVVANNCTLDLVNRTFRFYRGHPSSHFDIYWEYTGSID